MQFVAYELDNGYLAIINTSTKIEKSWLFIDNDIEIFQNWIIDKIHKRLFKKLK